jgi:hypothetical protein
MADGRRALAVDGVRRGSANVRIGHPLPRAADGQVRGRIGFAVRRLGGRQPIQGGVRLTPHFHLPLTTSDVLQLFLVLVAPMWWKVGVLFVITYTRFHSLHCGAQS